jgi:HD superfamily phosphodiesterase
MDQSFLKKTKKCFLEAIKNGKPIYDFFPRHVAEVEKWAKRILKNFPHADEEVVLLSVWLHDIGQADGDYSQDHAIKSEKEARRFLSSLKLPSEKINQIAHCVRAHRNKDIKPKTLEAKIVAAADSASHMTDINYLVMLQDGISKKEVLEKLDRDYRDIKLIPQLKRGLEPLYFAWKKLLEIYPE